MKKLYRCSIDKQIGGVCCGIANYTNTDPSIWRIIFLVLIFSPTPIVLFYLLACIILPKNELT